MNSHPHATAIIQSIKDGAHQVDAPTAEDYNACTNWIYENGGRFSYHFETGEAFMIGGRRVEVFGL